MAEGLDFIIEELAFHLVHTDGALLAEAERKIRRLITQARQEERAAGAPYSDTVAGFLVWLDGMHHVTPSP